MTSTDIAFAINEGELPSTALARASTPAAKRDAGKYALETVPVKGLANPVPRFALEMPWAHDGEDVVEDILLDLVTSDDIATATQGSEVLKVEDVEGQAVTVLSATVRKSDLENATWGCYFLLRVQLDSGEVVPVSCGAAQVMVSMWKLHTAGLLPCRGTFVKLGQAVKGRKQPVGFRVEQAF